MKMPLKITSPPFAAAVSHLLLAGGSALSAGAQEGGGSPSGASEAPARSPSLRFDEEAVAQAREWLLTEGPGFLVQVAVALVLFLVFLVLAKILGRIVRRFLDAESVQLSRILKDFVVSATVKLTFFVGLLVALSQVGIDLGPLLAGLGVAGFIIGFAVKDSLSNFAAGLMILGYRPYDVGDSVEAAGVSGKVSKMSLVSTTIVTFDNQRLVVPNSKIWGGVIKNVSAEPTRRVDLVFGIGYDDDVDRAEEILRDVVTSHELVLDDPEPVIKLHELADSSLNFVCRPWVWNADYWTVRWDVIREVKRRFDAEGISFPYPQRDVHLHGEK